MGIKRTIHGFKLELDRAPEHYGNSWRIYFNDSAGDECNHYLSCGLSDDLDIFRDDKSGDMYALAVNRSLGYASLQIFEGSECVFDFMLDGEGFDDNCSNQSGLKLLTTLMQWY